MAAREEAEERAWERAQEGDADTDTYDHGFDGDDDYTGRPLILHTHTLAQ